MLPVLWSSYQEAIFSAKERKKLYMEIIEIDMEDEEYPQRLLKIKNFPTKIYAKRNIELLNAKSIVGIVGTRKCTDYGRIVAREFAKELSKKGICIISGMAIGIDGIAHNVAIEQQGKTIAVLGSGLNHISPPENEWLFHKILENGGCIISEYPPDTESDKNKFPIRNRIISGISDGVLVVEAIHRSGSSITAKYAKAEGKQVFAIPSNIYSSAGIGTNRLIQEGAILVTKPEQILEYINDNKKALPNEKLPEEEQKAKEKGSLLIMPREHLPIYRAMSDKPIHINELTRKLKRPIQEINQIITMMELGGYIYQQKTNYFVRNEENIDFEEIR